MARFNKLISVFLAASVLTATAGALEIKPIQEAQTVSTVSDTLSEFLLSKLDRDLSEIASIVEASGTETAAPIGEAASAGETHLTNSATAATETDEGQPENTNNELKLELTDGTYSLYSFSEDIKFTDETGVIRYKDTTIIPQTDNALNQAGYTYTNGTNDYRINFAPAVDKGVFTEYDGVKLGFVPIATSEEYAQSGSKTTFLLDGEETDSFEYPDLYGEGSILRYTAQLNALKKDIILPEYTGQNTFRFILDTYGNTAVLGEDGKTVQILNPETGEVLRTLAPIYAYDSFGGTYSDDFHYTEDCRYTLSLREDGRYDMGVVVSEEYLSNPELIYPVTIDPISTSPSNLQDAPVYSSQATKNWGGSTTMCFGRSSTNGSGRCYIKFNIASIGSGANVTGATLTLRETTGRTTSTTTGIYMASGSWTETGLTWNNKPGYGSLQSSLNINSPGGSYVYNFNVKSAVQQWANGTANNGFAIVSDHENDTRNFWRAFATKEYSTSSFQPVLKVDYTALSLSTVTEGVYYIRNQNSGKYIDVYGQNTSSGTNIHQWSFHGDKCQHWKITSVGGGWYTIRPQHAPSMAMDVQGNSSDDGTNIIQYTYHGGAGQQFGFIKLSNGAYRIVTKATNGQKGISVNGRYTDNGANIHQYSYDSRYTNDHWWIEQYTVYNNTDSNVNSKYDRTAAKNYAEQYALIPNTDYKTLDLDCTNYVSQCIYNGGLPMISGEQNNINAWRVNKVLFIFQEFSNTWSIADSFAQHWGHIRGGGNQRAYRTIEFINAQAVINNWDLFYANAYNGDVIQLVDSADNNVYHSMIINNQAATTNGHSDILYSQHTGEKKINQCTI